jgi:hypothetical protein
VSHVDERPGRRGSATEGRECRHMGVDKRSWFSDTHNLWSLVRTVLFASCGAYIIVRASLGSSRRKLPMCTDPWIWHGSNEILRISSGRCYPVTYRKAHATCAYQDGTICPLTNTSGHIFASHQDHSGAYMRRFQLRHCFIQTDV